MTPDDASLESYFLHYPRVVTEHSVAVLNGTLRTLDFETFEKLDRDWARKNYFEQTQPVFWIRTGDLPRGTETDGAKQIQDVFAAKREDGMLIYNALLAVTSSPYPDPRLSVQYLLKGEGVSRLVGVFERTWLLNRRALAPLADEQLRAIATLAEEWQQHGFRYDDVVFSPLRGLASLASTFTERALGMLPLIVSLEGFLLPLNVTGIAAHMATVIKRLLGNAAPDDIDTFMRAVYDARSKVVHGEEIPDEETAKIFDQLLRLTSAVVIAATREMMQRQLASDDFDLLRKEWRS
jgi:hypothetical protein